MLVKSFEKFTVHTFPNLDNLKNITPIEIEEHIKLYGGYVQNCNILREKIMQMTTSGQAGTPEWAELVRRLGFEYNGVRLHELYFENLSGTAAAPTIALKETLESAFDGWENFQTHFLKMAAMRGVGWTILYMDPVTGCLNVHWINLHEDGHPAGFTPLLVMDCWEHAWTAYLKPTERAKYIEDFWSNIDWAVVEKRLG
jgi:Fe-Mn family superoxide dismutase